jgi:hypothetical protein
LKKKGKKEFYHEVVMAAANYKNAAKAKTLKMKKCTSWIAQHTL